MTASNTSRKRSHKSSVHSRPLNLWQDSSANQEVRIEILPMIDVIFCILTFFILGAVGLSRQQAISLDLPRAASGTPQMREMLVVSLDDFGQVYVEKQLVTHNQLFNQIKSYHQLNPEGLMVLHASRNATYNEVIEVLDMLREVGGDRVALATLPGENEASNTWNDPTLSPLPSQNGLPGGYPNNFPSTLPNNPANGLDNYPTDPALPSQPNGSPIPQTTPPNN
ncbi:probable biopolymer transport protein [Crocosphaera subtropica ATCC 51142]|uniref:Probable biopolymer transport protein n=1 Tax=Crocosphaera subtropica (strain ATCC 51142 / BH68) TaxID=43989 RepID=B1WTZ9_CROS5|nr:biopolymer transporter ExbD [Crocosphaera subtropica]ACB50465.1 probable biopolymer transport protein [Crocosphaera subtropica ATCC 51142]